MDKTINMCLSDLNARFVALGFALDGFAEWSKAC